jgi:UDP-N-acetylglucosamine 4,6-dehydratase
LVSRDEYKQSRLREEYSSKRWAGLLRWILADVRDLDRMRRVVKDADYVIHAAAMKRIESIDYNPDEAVGINVVGTSNVGRACYESERVKRAVFLGTDKAVYPINTYGRTKAVAEDLWRSFNFHKPIFTAVRYGNVMGSRGSVLEVYKRMIDSAEMELPVTDPSVTRFWMTPYQAADMAIWALKETPGVTLVAKSRSFRLGDLAMVMSTAAPKITGLPSTQKQAECMLTKYEAVRTYLDKRWYRMAPERQYDERTMYNPDMVVPLEAKDITSDDDVMNPEEVKEALAKV